MAAIDLLLGKTQFKTKIGVFKVNGQITQDGLDLDAAMSVGHEYTANITKNPIEDGSDVTDHIRLQNVQLNINGFVAEKPLTLIDAGLNTGLGVLASGLGANFGQFGQLITSAGAGTLAGLLQNRDTDDNLYPIKAYKFLVEIWKNRIPFGVRTNLSFFDNMVISRLSFPRNAELGKSLEFNATLEQITVVQTQTTFIPESVTSNPSAASKQKLGKQPVQEVENDTILFNAGEKFGLFSSVGG